MIFLFFPTLGEIRLGGLGFLLFAELSILECFSTWVLKHARNPVRKYFQTPITF